MVISDEDREWIDTRADQLFRESERQRGGIRPATVMPQDFRDYFVVQAAWERFDALTRKPIPTSIGSDWQWLEQEEQPRLSDGYTAVMAVAPGKWMVRRALPLTEETPMPTLDERIEAERRGAERMRERAAQAAEPKRKPKKKDGGLRRGAYTDPQAAGAYSARQSIAKAIRALPLTEENSDAE